MAGYAGHRNAIANGVRGDAKRGLRLNKTGSAIVLKAKAVKSAGGYRAHEF
jgi:hypothetical protein